MAGYYDIESKDFALSSEGIHLLRNRFNYKTISFYDIHKATFTKAVETKNVVLTLIVGALLVAFAVFQAIGVYEEFYDPSVHHIYIESILLPVLPLLVGFYCVYLGVKKIPLLIIELENEKHKLSLRDIIDSGRMEALETYLKERLREKFYDSTAL
jgi:hypothetical protein